MKLTSVDYCGLLALLRQLAEQKLISEQEQRKIAARVAAQNGIRMVISF